MKTLNISKRLLNISEYVNKGMTVADIGSDHALLPCFLVKESLAPFAIAGELNEGPLQVAQNQVASLGLENQISVRKGNGLSVLDAGEVEAIVVAGMGGALIKSILEEGKEKLIGVKRLILQPNVGENHVRQWLNENGWKLVDETVLEEDDKIYEIIVAEPNSNDSDEAYEVLKIDKSKLYQIGPILWQKKPPILKKKWQHELIKMKFIFNQLENAKQDSELQTKRERFLQEIEWISEVIEWLERDKASSKSLKN